MRYIKFVIPLLLVALIDWLFQAGVWERYASPQSYAGMSILRKHALLDPAMQRIDFVTLGSSRPVYGIDHEALTKAAGAAGKVYADISIPGMHWMGIDEISRWLQVHHPEIRGNLIALSVQDFLSPGNGTYELGIAYPFHARADIGAMSKHVAFDWHNPATYALYSGLFQYHEDLRDLIAHPHDRQLGLDFYHAMTPQQVLQQNANETATLCPIHLFHLPDCSAAAELDPARKDMLTRQCGMLPVAGSYRATLSTGEAQAPALQEARTLIRELLSRLSDSQSTIVVLMPMHSVWLNDALPAGAHAWTLSVLEPLVQAGRIKVFDYTDFFNDAQGNSDCSKFFDIFHNNVDGRSALAQKLLPQVESAWFSTDTRK